MDINKALYHLKEADKELSQFTGEMCTDNNFDRQSYLIAMSSVFDFANSLKPISCEAPVVRDDY